MKKILSMLLALVLITTTAAGCRNTTPEQTDGGTTAETALEVLQKIWDRLDDTEKFPVYGGDANNMVDGAPGDFNVADTDGLMHNLLVPQSQLGSIHQAASLVHGMMSNNFTCGVFRLKDGADAFGFADAMGDSFKNNQWLCGTPEKLLVAVIGGDYVLAAYGLGDALDRIQTKLTEAYPNAEIRRTESIV